MKTKISNPPSEYDIDVFTECFDHELESFFSRRIACCDECHDEFISKWPYAYSADDAEFQCNSISLDAMHWNTRMSNWYDRGDYDILLPYLKCPCGASLKHNIWPYDLPFDPDEYKYDLEELSEIAKNTPFLLYTHPLAEKTFHAIKHLSEKTNQESFSGKLWRGRGLDPDERVNLSTSHFDFPPPHVVNEGRYNHAGDSLLYLASTEKVCREEMRNHPNLVVSSFDFNAPMKILDLARVHHEEGEFTELLSFIVFSSLVSSRSRDTGRHRPEYVYSRYVKDCAVHAGFDAIQYASTRLDTATYNLVVINKKLTLAACAKNFMTHNISISTPSLTAPLAPAQHRN